MDVLYIAGAILCFGVIIAFFYLISQRSKNQKNELVDKNEAGEQIKKSIPLRTYNQNNSSGSGIGQPHRVASSSHRSDDTSFITGVVIGSVLGDDSSSKHESSEAYHRSSSDIVSPGDGVGNIGGPTGGD